MDLHELAPEALDELEAHAGACADCARMLQEHRDVLAAIREFGSPLHVEGTALTRFAISRAAPNEPDYDLTRLSETEIQQIEGHVSSCPRCQLTVNEIIQQYRDMDRFLTQAGVPSLSIDRAPPRAFARSRDWLDRVTGGAKNSLIHRPSFPTAGVALGVLLVALWVGPWLRDPYDALSHLERTETEFLTRGSGSGSGSEIAGGMALLNGGRFSEAIARLQPVVEGASDPELRGYARYLSGVAWVEQSKTEIFGRVLDYDTEALDRGIEHLEAVPVESRSGRVIEDAYWVLGKTYLMKREPERAATAFREVVKLEGRRAEDARSLLAAIAALETLDRDADTDTDTDTVR